MPRTRNLCLAIACCATATLAVPPWSAARDGVPHRSTGATTLPSCHFALAFHRNRFPRHLDQPNPWLSLVPGTVTVLHGTVREDDGKLHPHTINSTVSRVTKRLDGVRTRVVFERDYEDGRLQESELAFEAQDRRGNVWNVGEYPEEYERGRLSGAPDTWIAGLARARPGLGMPRHPRVGTPAYLQGSAPRVGFRDCARVVARGRKICIPARCYSHGLLIKEWAPRDPAGGHQLKYYARHVGTVRVAARDDVNPEVLHLRTHARIGHRALRKIDNAVLRQDERGYHVRPHLYGRTPRAHRGHCHG